MTSELHGSTRPRRRTALAVLAGVVGLAILAGGGWWGWKTWVSDRGEQQLYVAASIQRADLEDLVTATGSLQPRDYVDVGAQVSGQLRKLLVEVGSEVREGDLLAEIDAETSAARVDASRAQLKSQQAQMVERELNLVKTERDLQRQKNLMREEASTAEALQNAETAARTARAQINSLKAQMEQLQATMRVEEANLKFTRIYAPMSGTVVSITARQGQTLNANQSAPTLMRVADLSTMTVQAQVSEADVRRLRQSMSVYFTTLGGQGRRWYGQLKKVEPTPTVTNNVVLYNALFDVPNANRSLMTQMTVQVFFVVAEAQDVLVVPMAALTLQRGGQGARERANARVASNGVRNEGAPRSEVTGGGEGKAVASKNEKQSGNPDGTVSNRDARGEVVKDVKSSKSSAEMNPVPGEGARRGRDTSATEGNPSGKPPVETRRPGFDREAWQRMSPEERERMRSERRERNQAKFLTGEGSSGPSDKSSAETERPRPDRELRQGMSPEERQRLRSQREERGRNSAAAETPQTSSGKPVPKGRQDQSATSATSRDGGDGKRRQEALPDASSSMRPESGAGSSRPPRKATVRVIGADGSLSDREVTIGVSNRVHAEVLSGLVEGERVVAGVRQPDKPRNDAQPQRGVGGSPGGVPGMPGAGGPGKR